jgi:hypothetical protein
MGLMQHNVVVATTWHQERFAEAAQWLSNLPTEDARFYMIGPPMMNREATIVLLPDGSKEGWADSDEGDERRRIFVSFLKTHDYEDGSSPWKFVDVSFGERGVMVEATNCENELR